jgi:hypothetical protein
VTPAERLAATLTALNALDSALAKPEPKPQPKRDPEPARTTRPKGNR